MIIINHYDKKTNMENLSKDEHISELIKCRDYLGMNVKNTNEFF